jgi:hypothetical protein
MSVSKESFVTFIGGEESLFLKLLHAGTVHYIGDGSEANAFMRIQKKKKRRKRGKGKKPSFP